MATLCLASSIADLKARIARIVVARSYDDKPVTAGDIHAEGAATALLKDALRPNLVQTLIGTPAFVHGGPSPISRMAATPSLPRRRRSVLPMSS